ncbi:NADH-quinone oxidoreductase subunit G [Cellulomonas chengniuliangii]|uniref:NADH-quinone oxidoreductase subunit G n=1 Tax=Cellulomonas chengniuliangii TaxID=2968084 RepID=A0ABY5KWL2_9CELL|nr:NADH-quinone oxidoreductase subunit G [Cellulomonas chengniuliangii]MCC2309563.1 NADH-quinone oxidoreductase subunit G [Cellulomonas chengniuliangii]UUI74882.1 NADH-quinone oxidoreductase subunit G [Cellulomonas chengniuliangii]
MTITTPKPGSDAAAQGAGGATPAPADAVTFTIDGLEVAVPKGTLVIRAAEQVGIQIPRFCDHPLLAPAGACRQCLVEVWAPGRDGKLAKMPKPQASCTLEATPGMQVKTQHTSPEADKAQHGVMELLLINHPLDCPVCDKGGECPLQNQAMTNGRATTRFVDIKRTFPKPIAISTQILLDRERCVLCQRCTRFSKEIAGDAFIDLQKRGANQQIGRFAPEVLGFEAPAGAPRGDVPVGPAEEDESGEPFASYFSGNTVQICPVGALTSASYRFRARPFDLVSTAGVSEHDSCGSAIRVDHRRGVVLRRLAGEDAAVNEEWITDKDRFAFTWQSAPDRITTPMVRDEATGELRPASWVEALDVAAEGLRSALAAGDGSAAGVGVLPGGRITLEDAYAYGKFARVALGSNDVDLRSRPLSAEEDAFLGHHVAGRAMQVTFADLEKAPVVLLAALEAEEEAGITFLRLRKGVVGGTTRVVAVAPFASRGLERLDGTLVTAAPGTEAEVLDAVEPSSDVPTLSALASDLALPGAVILVGERLAAVPGGLTAALRLAERTGARLAWIPRRAGERGGVEAGALPSLLPGGRPVADAAARVDVAAAWDVAELPATPGRTATQILEAARTGALGALVVGGVDLRDLPDPAAAREALSATPFVVSLEVRASEVTAVADVVLPVAPPVEKGGTFVTWEGRPRPFPQALTSTAVSDHRVLDRLADALGVTLGVGTLAQVHAELDQLGAWDGARVDAPATAPAEPPAVAPGHAVLATWHMLLDSGRLQDGEAFLAGTAKRPVARISAATAAGAGVVDGGLLAVSTDAGTIELPVVVTDMPDHVVWLPTNSPGSAVRESLHAGPGALVRLAPGTENDVTDAEVRA